MKYTLSLLLLFVGTATFAQRINYEPIRQSIRIDAGMMIFGDIAKVGVLYGSAYQYDFLNHLGAGVAITSAVHHPAEFGEPQGSRMGASLYAVGRLFGLKYDYDVKVIGGAYYGSHHSSELTDNGITTEGSSRTGFSPLAGVGLDYRLGDWVLSLDLNMWFEQNLATYTGLSLGTAYRF